MRCGDSTATATAIATTNHNNDGINGGSCAGDVRARVCVVCACVCVCICMFVRVSVCAWPVCSDTISSPSCAYVRVVVAFAACAVSAAFGPRRALRSTGVTIRLCATRPLNAISAHDASYLNSGAPHAPGIAAPMTTAHLVFSSRQLFQFALVRTEWLWFCCWRWLV